MISLRRNARTISLFAFVFLWAAASPPAEAQATAAPAPQANSDLVTCPANLTAPPLSAPLAAAQELYRTGKFEEALAAYKPIAEAGGADGAVAYAGIARIYLRQRNPAAALDAANKAVALTPGKAPATVALGEVDFRLGKFGDAQQLWLTSIRACEPDARANLGMARLARATSNSLRAKQELDRAHQMDPHDPDIQRLWMSSLSRQDRIKQIRDRLAEQTDDDDDERKGLEQALAVLEDESENPLRSCKLVQHVTSTSTKFAPFMIDANRLRGYGLEVKFNGANARLLLDTGASGILIDRKVAEKAGIKPVIRTEVKGLGDKGPMNAFVGFADSIKVGELEFKGCYVEVADKRSVADSEGLIGADVFSSYLIELNFPDAKFKLTQLPPVPSEANAEVSLESHPSSTHYLHDRYTAPEMKDYTRVFKFSNHLLIPTRVNDSPEAKLFMIDSGAWDNLISRQAAKETTGVGSDSNTVVKGLSGSVGQVYRANSVNLTFSHFRQKRDDMIAFDMTNMSDAMGTEISGILGFNMLRLLDIKIDYRDGLVDFQYDPNRIH
jgi:tetratricopeptide (TPR) repeat protein